jgi:cation-transporting ATPase E
VPGFFLALAAGAPRARPGYVRRVAWFTVPAGAVAAASTFAAYAMARADTQTSGGQARTTAAIVLFALGLWVLGLLSRPLDPTRIGLVLGMAAAGVLAMVVPLSSRLFALDAPPLHVLVTALVIAAGGAATISVLVRAVRSRAR